MACVQNIFPVEGKWLGVYDGLLKSVSFRTDKFPVGDAAPPYQDSYHVKYLERTCINKSKKKVRF